MIEILNALTFTSERADRFEQNAADEADEAQLNKRRGQHSRRQTRDQSCFQIGDDDGRSEQDAQKEQKKRQRTVESVRLQCSEHREDGSEYS